MSKPIATMALRDSVPGAPGDTPKGTWIPRRVPPDVLLLQCPPWFNGIEVGRVRRQVEETDTGGLAEVGDLRSMVGSRVVHDQNVASPQLREQPDAEPPDEPFAVGGGEHGSEGDPSADPDGSDERQILAPIHRNALLVHASALDPRVAARHRTIEASFVEKHESVDRDLRDLAKERLPFHDDVGSESLQRPAAFF